ncbi:MAG: hypothetical protein ACI4U3_04345 [Traorella sp.]
MKVLVICAGGISTNILASVMKNYSRDDEIIRAVSYENARVLIPEYDIVFVAPQMNHVFNTIEKDCMSNDVICRLMDMKTYGCMDGETIINLARDLIGDRNKKKGDNAKMKKLKITLACAGGVSTSILCNRIKTAVKNRGIEEVECNAYATSALDKAAPGSDVILLGPQVSYLEDDVVKKYPDIPVRLMDMRDYGTMNAEKIVKELFEEFGW